jgi:hypothetical protein
MPFVLPAGLKFFVFRPLNGKENFFFLCELCASSGAGGEKYSK